MKRFFLNETIYGARMEEFIEGSYINSEIVGDYVLYEDHLAVVQKLEDRVALLEQSLESADGEVSDLMQQVADLNSEISYYESQPHIE